MVSSGEMLSHRLFLAAIFTWRENTQDNTGTTGDRMTYIRHSQRMTSVGLTDTFPNYIKREEIARAWDGLVPATQTKIAVRDNESYFLLWSQ